VERHRLSLSVVIPAYNEAGSIAATLNAFAAALRREGVDYEIVVVDDASSDGTADAVAAAAGGDARIRCVPSHNPRGFGYAVRSGLDVFQKDAVAIVMADESDSPDDLIAYWRLLCDGYDCAFGSRFMAGARVSDYPSLKLVLNRIVNAGIQLLFGHGYNDTTNAFKAYRREVIDTVQPLLSNHFNLTVELPLKAIVRGHSFAVVPISWTNRATGESKLALNEMGSRYLFIVLYAFLEKHLTRGDYYAGRPTSPGATPMPPPRRLTRFGRRRQRRGDEHARA
jgi:dolichol-phosphate mannosyltransferase